MKFFEIILGKIMQKQIWIFQTLKFTKICYGRSRRLVFVNMSIKASRKSLEIHDEIFIITTVEIKEK